MINKLIEDFNNGEILCRIDLVMRIIGGKWKPVILWHLGENKILRYGELKKKLGSITAKMLTQQLRELEEYDMVNRKVFHQVPPKVEYSLTDRGSTIIPLLEHMGEWGHRNIIKG